VCARARARMYTRVFGYARVHGCVHFFPQDDAYKRKLKAFIVTEFFLGNKPFQLWIKV
jgi:hypothetical protein